jgi:hypothetical protein
LRKWKRQVGHENENAMIGRVVRKKIEGVGRRVVVRKLWTVSNAIGDSKRKGQNCRNGGIENIGKSVVLKSM